MFELTEETFQTLDHYGRSLHAFSTTQLASWVLSGIVYSAAAQCFNSPSWQLVNSVSIQEKKTRRSY